MSIWPGMIAKAGYQSEIPGYCQVFLGWLYLGIGHLISLVRKICPFYLGKISFFYRDLLFGLCKKLSVLVSSKI